MVHTGDIKISSSIIGEIADNLASQGDEEMYDCSSYIIIPSLSDCHVHTPDTLGRGLDRDLSLKQWCNDTVQGKLQKFIFDYLDNNVHTPAFRTLVLYSYIQYVRNGVSFIVETGEADESSPILQECAQQIGIKGIVDYYEQYPTDVAETELICQGIHLPEEEELDQEGLLETRNHYEIDHPYLMTHCLETSWRRADIEKKFGLSTIELLAREHMLGKETILFHCVETTGQDIALLAKHQANVVHCPLSNLRSGAGSMNLCAMLQQGINVVLGTDFATHDIWDVMRATYGELKQSLRQNQYSADTVFDMATKHATVFSQKVGYSGQIEEGSSADLVFIRITDAISPLVSLPDFSNVLHNLVLYTRKDMIKSVMSNGKWILKDNQFMTVDEEQVLKDYSLIVAQLFQDFQE